MCCTVFLETGGLCVSTGSGLPAFSLKQPNSCRCCQALTLASLKPQEQQCKKEEAWDNLGAGPKGLLQRDVGDLAGVSGTCRARFCDERGGDAVGACHALPEAGKGGTRDLDWGSAQLLSGPRHCHIQRIIASNVADEGGQQSFVCQLDDLLSSVQRGGDLTNVGPLVLYSEAGQREGGIPGHAQLLRLQGSALPHSLPLPRGPAVHQLTPALVLQPPLHTDEVQAWCHREATVQGG
uniref:Uncharacterized protein n=1 Tax=Piliocolobus tephrosceles TaxID=591936 RepID=A0A8C9IXX7_9PRIM